MTPRELNIRAELYAEKLKNDQEEKITLAYMAARWQRVETLEPFDYYLEKMKQPKQEEMTDDEMKLKVRALNAALGGSVK